MRGWKPPASVRSRSARRSVLSILAAGLDQKPFAAEDPEWQLPLHENVRGPTYYH
jgi:hypothetical protein